MARPEDDPTQTFSGEEEEEEDGSSEEVSESESEPEPDKTTPSTHPVTKKPSSSKQLIRPTTTTTTTTTTTPAPASSSSSSEEDESGSESESDSDLPPKKSGKPDPTVKPIASKPMEIPPKAATKPRSKPTAPSSPPAAKSGSRAKRPVPETETIESKRAKKKATDAENGADGAKKVNGDDPKKQLFQRLWSEDDEVVILKGMSDYAAKKKADPIADMNAFHDFIKKSLHVDVSKTQLSDKVRRLKKKYVNNSKKEKTGQDRTFSKPHEQICYDLSKKLWGSNKGEDTSARVDNLKVSGSAKKNQNQRNGNVAVSSEVDGADGHKEVTAMEIDAVVEPFGPVLVGGSIGIRDSADQMIKNGWKLVTGSKRSEWEKKSKKLMVEEVELYSRRLELMHEQVKLVSEAMKSAQE